MRAFYIMVTLKSTSGVPFFISDRDYNRVSKHSWYIHKSKSNNTVYLRTFINKKAITLHRFILELDDPKILVDHKDGNGLNNIRGNLRRCSHADNQRNKGGYGKSKYTGVHWHPYGWCAKININGKQKHISFHKEEKDAAISYNNFAIKNGNGFHKLNKI